MEFKISNQYLELVVSSHGAEKQALYCKENNINYLRDVDKYWNRHAPLLFPIVGKLRDLKTNINNREYSMNQHGFVRDQEFELYSQTENELVLVNTYNEDTLKMYPFRYKVFVKYTLVDKTVHTEFKVVNEDYQVIPFNYGGHPGFRLPLYENETFEDYCVEFEKVENFDAPRVVLENGTLDFDTGEGYIWHSQGGNFNVPAMDNENKNLIFANDTRYIQLKENPAATEANYGWNLIGNPYPCYYDTRYMQFSSPITVRSGDSYAAYSPADDSYILSPLEAFFVQCSAENNIVSFDTEGRQTDNSVRTLSYAPARTRAMDYERSVLNLYLENSTYADHTRLVVNEGASLAYEIACDAAKFMSDDATVPQLFTIEGGERMAINERPLANGKAALGVYIGKAGSYTLSLDTKAMDTEVFLVDKLLGTETDLTTGSYAFTAEAGTFTDRFEIHMKRTGVVDGIEAVAAELTIEATAEGISVSNATTPIYIYSTTGALVGAKVGSAVTFDVPQGVYVVKVGDNVHKVVVK